MLSPVLSPGAHLLSREGRRSIHRSLHALVVRPPTVVGFPYDDINRGKKRTGKKRRARPDGRWKKRKEKKKKRKRSGPARRTGHPRLARDTAGDVRTRNRAGGARRVTEPSTGGLNETTFGEAWGSRVLTVTGPAREQPVNPHRPIPLPLDIPGPQEYF